MDIKARITQDLKAAMLAGNKQKVEALRMLKSAILDAEVSSGARELGLEESALVAVLAKEAKKRHESIQMYEQNNGDPQVIEQETFELGLIEEYLPPPMSEEDVARLVQETVILLDAASMKDMGKVVQAVKEKAGPGADGAAIAELTKKALSK